VNGHPREADGAPTFLSAHLRNAGVLWPLKHQQGVLDDVNVNVGKERTYYDKQA
jgi:hypothetical protein